jgi:hypothetical protein
VAERPQQSKFVPKGDGLMAAEQGFIRESQALPKALNLRLTATETCTPSITGEPKRGAWSQGFVASFGKTVRISLGGKADFSYWQ